jgi:hypothetical protein
MTITTNRWPLPAPSYSDNTLTVSRFLVDTPLVEKVLTNMALQRMFADQIFDTGPRTDSGSVAYSQVTTEGSYYTTRDVQQIAPGTEFPNLGIDEETLLVATVAKWGGRYGIPYEAIQSDRRDLLNRALTKIANTVARKVDVQALAAMNAAPILTAAASGDWSTANTDILGDLQTAISAIENLDMGYSPNTVILNPAQALDIRKDADIRGAMPRETTTNNCLWARDLDGIAGLSYYVSNRCPAGTVYVFQSKMLGSISDANPFYSRVVDKPETEEKIVMAARRFVPYVTDPKCCFKITSA